ncbi:MAG: GGDEF domain-containing protein [Bacillus sp. (in: firmicutes)]
MELKNAFITLKISPEKEKLLTKHLFHENIKRSKLFAKVVCLFESILILVNMIAAIGTGCKFNFPVYFLLYFFLLTMSCLMLLHIHRFERKGSFTERNAKRFEMGLLIFISFFLVWGAVVTLVDQREYGHVMAFAVNLMSVSVLFHASNRRMLLLYLLPILVLVVGLPFFQHSHSILMGHYINLAVFAFFCWLASRILYTNYASGFFNRLLLTESNSRLSLKIEENENINRELMKVNEKLERLSLIDELTQIPNRRGCQQYVEDALKAVNKKRKLSLIMLDIDVFKQFNDNYGHLEGDMSLKLVAQKLKSCLPSADSIAARFGGEEFMMAVFDLDNRAIYELAEKIRKAIFSMKINHEYSPFSDRVTISLGIASSYVTKEEDMEQLVQNADQALYQAKLNGRNRVEEYK